MKLINLVEQGEPQNDSVELYKRAYDGFLKTVRDHKKKHIFNQKVMVPEGEISYTVHVEELPFTTENLANAYFGELPFYVDFTPNMDPKPVIPLNILSTCVDEFCKSLREINPDLWNKPSIYPTDLLDMFKIKFNNFTVFPKNSVLVMSHFMDTPTYNLKLKTPRKFGDLFYSKSYMLQQYNLEPGDLPTFSDDYTSTSETLLKRAKTLYKALKTGTWKGHQYQLSDSNSRSSILLYPNDMDYNKQTKRITPNFTIKLNLGYELVDGVKNSPEDSPLSEEERIEFRDFLKKRFQNFGIDY